MRDEKTLARTGIFAFRASLADADLFDVGIRYIKMVQTDIRGTGLTDILKIGAVEPFSGKKRPGARDMLRFDAALKAASDGLHPVVYEVLDGEYREFLSQCLEGDKTENRFPDDIIYLLYHSADPADIQAGKTMCFMKYDRWVSSWLRRSPYRAYYNQSNTDMLDPAIGGSGSSGKVIGSEREVVKQGAYIGLMKALASWDPSRGDFIKYADRVLFASVSASLNDETGFKEEEVKNRSTILKAMGSGDTVNESEGILKDDVSKDPKVLARKTGLSISVVEGTLNHMQEAVSYETIKDMGLDNRTTGDWIPGNNLEKEELVGAFQKAISLLAPEELDLLVMYVLPKATNQKVSAAHIAKELGIKESTVLTKSNHIWIKLRNNHELKRYFRNQSSELKYNTNRVSFETSVTIDEEEEFFAPYTEEIVLDEDEF